MNKEELLKNFVLDKSETLFVERGYAETSMALIAAACEISKPTLYRYFPGKHELFDSLSRRAMADILGQLDRLLGQDKDKREILRDILTSSGAMLENKKRFLQMYLRQHHLMVHPHIDEELNWYADFRARIVDSIGRLLEDILRPDIKRKFGVAMAATTVFYILEGYFNEHVLAEHNDLGNHQGFILSLLENGVLKGVRR